MKNKNLFIVLSAFLILCCAYLVFFAKNTHAYSKGENLAGSMTISRTGNYGYDERDCELGSCWDMDLDFRDGDWTLIEQWHCISTGIWNGPNPVKSWSAIVDNIDNTGRVYLTITIHGSDNQQKVKGRISFQPPVTFSSTSQVTGVTNSSSNFRAKVGKDTLQVYEFRGNTDTTDITFNHAISSNPSSSTYLNHASYTQITTNVDETNTKTETSGLGNNYTSIYTTTLGPAGQGKKVCQTANFSPTSAKFSPSGTYVDRSASGSSSSGACIYIYRDAEAYIGLTTEIASTVTRDLTDPSSNQNNESHINKDSDSTSANVEIGNNDKIFMDSSANDATKKAQIGFKYTLTRGDPNTTYDTNRGITAEYTINSEKGSVNLDSPTSSKTVTTSHTLCNGPGEGCDETIPLGTFDRQVCRILTTNSTYLFKYNSTESRDPLTSTACAHVYRPYNFNLIPSANPDTSNVTYIGGEVAVNVKVTNQANESEGQEGTHSYSPAGTQVKVVRFIVDHSTTKDDIGDIEDNKLNGGVTNYNGNICDFYADKIGTSAGSGNKGVLSGSCADLTSQISGDGISNGNVQDGIPTGGLNTNITDTIPTNYAVGDKVCYAVAVNYVNSSRENSSADIAGYGTMNPNTWIISNASCNTTAKRPTFQVLGGSVFGEGKISGAVTKALDIDGSHKAFGSWVDFGVISNSEITKIASGAALAKGSDIDNANNTVDFCKYAPLTVANKICNNGNGLGEAGVNINTTTLDTILNRYANNSIAGKITSNSTIDITSSFTSFSDKYFTTVSENNNAKYRYTYINGNGTISANGDLTRGTTQVIYATGKITIASDLTYDSDSLSTIGDIPQYIIITKGGIDIKGSVERVDAWLIANNSTLNTCAEKTSIGGDNSVSLENNICDNKLNVNGPVFANNVLLYRTHGAEPTDPSVPAEVFDINAATYFWAHNQAVSGSNQVNTVYNRRLAPRV